MVWEGEGVGMKVDFVSTVWSVTTTSFCCVNPQAEIKNIEINNIEILSK